jgi:predicted PurR-regulated permease PerM
MAALGSAAHHFHGRADRISPSLTLAAVTVGLALLLGGVAYWIGPRLASEAQQLWSQLWGQFQHLEQTYGDTPWGKLLLHPGSQQHDQAFPSGLTKSAASVVTSTLGVIGTLFVIAVTAIYFALAPGLYADGLVRLLPPAFRPRWREILSEIGGTLQWWLLGQSIDMVVVGVLAWLGLMLLGAPLPMALGVLAGLFTFVPYFGAIAAMIPALLVTSTVSWSMALWTIVIFLVCHAVEGYLIAPFVQKRTVELPPALTVMSMTVMGAIFGVVGVILATPLVAIGLVLVREAYVHDVLERQNGRGKFL